MTELSTDRVGTHRAGMLRMSRGDPSAKGVDVLRAVRAYMVQGLALEALYNSGVGWLRSVGDDDRITAGSRLHNHLQSSREHNTSRAHSRSTSLANPSPASLSQHNVAMISFPWGKGRCGCRVTRKGVGSLGQLGSWVNCGVCGG